MKYIGPVNTAEVQSAYLAKGYVDETGFDVNDMQHPRWCHPVVPEDGAPGELEKRLTDLGIEWELYGGHDGIRASFDSTLLYLPKRRVWIPRWPAKDGKYGWGTAPQYAIRDDMGRYDLDHILRWAVEQ